MTPPKKAESAWTQQCRDIAARFDSIESADVGTLRNMLVEMDALLKSAPLDCRKRYARLEEAKLVLASERMAAAWLEQGPHWPSDPFEPEYDLRDSAIATRCLDILLRDADSGRHLFRRNPEANWLTSDGTAYVIPLHRPEQPEPSLLDRAGYDKRGILHHRVVPTSVEGLPVRLVVPRTIASAMSRRRPMRGGVGAFAGLSADLDVDRDGFLITSVQIDEREDKLAKQAEATAGCDFFLWPELSIDDGSLAIISDRLRHLALEDASPAGVIVAGSWHRLDEQGIMRNLAPILTGAGRKVDQFAKIAIYADKDIGFERVTEGAELLILVGDGHLSTVCICKDFSDLQDRNPWTALPVDVVLVVSMGDDPTMAGHLVRAQELRKGHGRLTFIVQQGLWNFHDPARNYLLPAPDTVPTDCNDTILTLDETTVEFGGRVDGNLHQV